MIANGYAMPTKLKSILDLAIGLGWFLACVAPSVLAGEKMSGRAVFFATPPTTIPIGAIADEHVLRHGAERGIQMEMNNPAASCGVSNTQTKKSLVASHGELNPERFSGADWLKDCSLLRTGSCDLVHGRGACFGYQIWVAPNGDRLVAKYSGVILPDAKSDKKPPDTILRGTWVYVRGSGIYAGVAGAGRYSGKYRSATEYELEWSGEIERLATAEQQKGE